MQYKKKFPHNKKAIKIKQLNLSALLFGDKIVRSLGVSKTFVQPFYSNLFYRIVQPHLAKCQIELVYRTYTQRVFRCTISVFFRSACNMWFPSEKSPVFVDVEDNLTGEVIELYGVSDDCSEFKLSLESQEKWKNVMFKLIGR